MVADQDERSEGKRGKKNQMGGEGGVYLSQVGLVTTKSNM